MTNAQIEDMYPLTAAQQGILFHNLMEPTHGQYLVQSYFFLDDCNIDVYKKAWQYVLTLHPILRTSFLWEDLAEPLQVVQRKVLLPIIEQDWRNLTCQEQQTQLESYLAQDRSLGLQLTQAPLMRLSLFRCSQTGYQVVWTFQHLILDGWSQFLVRDQVKRYYEAAIQTKETSLHSPLPFREYISWLKQQDLSAARAFWQSYLHGFSTPLSISDHTQNNKNSQQDAYGIASVGLSQAQTDALHTAIRQNQLTMNTLLQGMWALLLARYFEEADVVFGETMSGRSANIDGINAMVGMFVNVLPVRIQVPKTGELLSWLKNIQEQQFATHAYEYTPQSVVREGCAVSPQTPLFESVLAVQNYPASHEGPEMLHERAEWYRERTNYKLSIDVQVKTELILNAMFDTEHVSSAFMNQILNHLKLLLLQFIEHPTLLINELRLPTSEDYQRSLAAWNQTAYVLPSQLCLHHMFETQVSRTPRADAVVFKDKTLSYQELNTSANQLAHYLIEVGVGPDVIVGIYMERSLDLAVALLAILKAGGAYLPIDLESPPARVSQFLEDAQSPLCITQQHLASNIESRYTVFIIDQNQEMLANYGTSSPDVALQPDHLVSLYYTSGSTGKPKGVANTHRGWANRMLWMQSKCQLQPGERVLHKTTLAFDDAAVEIFWPLTVGGCIVMLEPGMHRDAAAMRDATIQQHIAIIQFVPTMLRIFLEEINTNTVQSMSHLRYVISSGEALQTELVLRFTQLFGERVILRNQWGPTEVSIDATSHECTQQEAQSGAVIPIGTPIFNHKLMILDTYLQPAPMGISGEIYLAGIGLARGYLNDPAKTASTFIANPFECGERMYRTGDRGYYLNNGSVVFQGRTDNQVKIRGMRIEPGEIEQVIYSYPGIRDASVQVHIDQRQEKFLAAYVVGITSNQVTDLRTWLHELLPAYMLPLTFITLDALPLTSNGKIDRRALPAVEITRQYTADSFVAPRTEVEERLAAIWSQVLGIAEVGIHDNFFEIGGHSLLATRIIVATRHDFDLDLPLRLIFDQPTITNMASAIENIIDAEIAQMTDEELYAHTEH